VCEASAVGCTPARASDADQHIMTCSMTCVWYATCMEHRTDLAEPAQREC
jgi:hypothetical protein